MSLGSTANTRSNRAGWGVALAAASPVTEAPSLAAGPLEPREGAVREHAATGLAGGAVVHLVRGVAGGARPGAKTGRPTAVDRPEVRVLVDHRDPAPTVYWQDATFATQ